MFRAAQWHTHTDSWTTINPSFSVLSWIREGVPIPFVSIPPPFALPNRQSTAKESSFIEAEVASLCQSGAIRQTRVKPVCISPIWCIPKKNGSFRLITDLRELNKYAPCPAFQYEDIRAVLQSIQPKDHLVTIDLKNGYHHLAVHKEFQKYLGFSWKKKYYIWQVLPFGLAVSPFYFCKCIRQVITYLRSSGVRVSAYVDDFILAAQPQDAVSQRDFVLTTLESLGFTINVDKSSLQPCSTKVHIGYKIVTDNVDNLVWISIPQRRIQRVRHDIQRLLGKGRTSARALARVAGQCVSMAKAIVPAKLLLRNLYRLLKTKTSWQDSLVLDTGTVEDLQWWLSALKYWNGTAVNNRAIDIQVTSDASSSAWGGHCLDKEAQGFWTPSIVHRSSNYRELLAVLLCLVTFIDTLKNKNVQFLTDNVCAAAYINFQGGPCQDLTQLAQAIWSTALENHITVCARHLAGSDNGRADGLSRLAPIYEWKLHPRLWRHLDSRWGPHSIDRFASITTTQLPRYNSRFLDPLSEGVDALAQSNWHQENNYVNSPFRLLPQVIQVIQQQQADATVIAPWWPSQPWFCHLQELSVQPPVRLPNTVQTFRQMSALPEPLHNRKWKIYAWRISGRIDSEA